MSGFSTTSLKTPFKALDVAVARGFIDQRRVGVGGISHGTFVPLYMMQKHDRIAAISISTGVGWGLDTHYSGNAQIWRDDTFGPPPIGQGADYWRKIDIAEHIDEIEAPLLMNLPDVEWNGHEQRFVRRLYDAGKPYDAYVFAKESHIKWQPAHQYAIMSRNVDWFRFWLQDYEDPDPDKSEQYARWRKLRELQCKNPRSLRNYCRMRN